MLRLSSKILSEPINRWAFSRAGTDIYLVGGYLRDTLLSRRRGDIDYVVRGRAEDIGRALAQKFKGTLVNIERHQTARVILTDGRTVDLTVMGSSIDENLSGRDFTINAMAWRPGEEIIDPYQGTRDLMRKVIRVVSPINLVTDPLRILRAYRQAVQLGFVIWKETRKVLRRYSGHITEAASERITDELCKILNHGEADIFLKQSLEDGVLEKLLSAQKERLRKNLVLMKKYREYLEKDCEIAESAHDLKSMRSLLKREAGQGLRNDGLVRLAILSMEGVTDLAKAKHIRFSVHINKAVQSMHSAVRKSRGKITDEKLYDIYKAAGDYHLESAYIIFVIRKERDRKIIRAAHEYRMINRKQLLSGNDIMRILNTRQGILIGDIKRDIHRNRFLGFVKTKAEAQNWVLKHFA